MMRPEAADPPGPLGSALPPDKASTWTGIALPPHAAPATWRMAQKKTKLLKTLATSPRRAVHPGLPRGVGQARFGATTGAVRLSPISRSRGQSAPGGASGSGGLRGVDTTIDPYSEEPTTAAAAETTVLPDKSAGSSASAWQDLGRGGGKPEAVLATTPAAGAAAAEAVEAAAVAQLRSVRSRGREEGFGFAGGDASERVASLPPMGTAKSEATLRAAKEQALPLLRSLFMEEIAQGARDANEAALRALSRLADAVPAECPSGQSAPELRVRDPSV